LTGAPLGAPQSTRPLCAYPKVARWVGKGSPDEEQNYTCATSKGEKAARP
jgi:hypothetical protein